MNPYVAEFIGTAILVIFGDGVVANVVLSRTKGNSSGWIVIAAGWGMAVFVAVFCVAAFSGAHINPAVTIALTAAGKFDVARAPLYILAQLLGGFVGAVLVWLFYQKHFDVTDDADAKLAVFCTAPNIRSTANNFLCEAIGTFLLVFPIMLMVNPTGLGALGALPVGLLVFAIGMSLGGTTGYAINPARDFSPRLAHAILPIRGKRDSDWGYAWIPVAAPIVGGLLAAGLARVLLKT
jgi:glycerol uptake facilitator protein